MKHARVTVRVGTRNGLCPDRTPTAGLVLDNDRLLERGGHLWRKETRDEVGGSSGRKGHHNLDGAHGEGDLREQRCRGHERSHTASSQQLASLEVHRCCWRVKGCTRTQ